jgi:hypothetical protein
MNVEKAWDARYTLGARYLSKNTVFFTGILNNGRELKCRIYVLYTVYYLLYTYFWATLYIFRRCTTSLIYTECERKRTNCMQTETRVKRAADFILVFRRCQQVLYVMLGGPYLSLCIGFTFPVEFLDVFRKAREVRNDELMPERSRNEDDIC